MRDKGKIIIVGGPAGLNIFTSALKAGGHNIDYEIITPEQAKEKGMNVLPNPVLELKPSSVPDFEIERSYTPDMFNNRAGRRKNKRK